MELKGKGVLVTGGGSGIGQSIAVSLAAEGCKVAVAGRLGTTVGLAEIKNSIRVTNIYPGEVDTPILEDRTAPIADEQRARMLKSEGCRRGRPDGRPPAEPGPCFGVGHQADLPDLHVITSWESSRGPCFHFRRIETDPSITATSPRHRPVADRFRKTLRRRIAHPQR